MIIPFPQNDSFWFVVSIGMIFVLGYLVWLTVLAVLSIVKTESKYHEQFLCSVAAPLTAAVAWLVVALPMSIPMGESWNEFGLSLTWVWLFDSQVPTFAHLAATLPLVAGVCGFLVPFAIVERRTCKSLQSSHGQQKNI